MIALHLLQPSGVKANTSGRAPHSLVAVETGCAVLADLVGDKVAPHHAVRQVALHIDPLRDQAQGCWRHGRFLQSLCQIVEVDVTATRSRLSTGVCKRCLQIFDSQLTGIPTHRVLSTRWPQECAGQPREFGSGIAEGFAHPTPIRIHGDKLIERPGRRNTRTSVVGTALQRRHMVQGGFKLVVYRRVHQKPFETTTGCADAHVERIPKRTGHIRKLKRVNHSSKYRPA